MTPTFTAIDHVQLAMPHGREAEAVRFYSGIFGFTQQEKPPALAVRGGCWFQSGPVHLHLGVEEDFRPARKAHPALRLHDLAVFAAHLQAHGVAFRAAEDIPSVRRGFIEDPFGNRIELVEEPSP